MRGNLIKRVLFVMLFLAAGLALVFLAFRDALPELLPMLKNGDVDELQAYLRSIGTWKGILCAALLQMLQVFSLVISGLPIQVAAGVVYGTFFALLICLLSGRTSCRRLRSNASLMIRADRASIPRKPEVFQL